MKKSFNKNMGRIQFLWIVLLGLLLHSCSSKNDVKVMDTNFRGEIEEQQNLIFQFNKDIYPDSILNSWDSTAYIEFEPKVAGSFRWTNSNELVFSPAKGFQAGVEYKATLTHHLLDKTPKQKKYKLGKDKNISFHTAPLKVIRSRSSWVKGKETANTMVQLDFDFNYETDVQQAASKLKLSHAGNNVTFNAVSRGVGKTLSVQILPVVNKDQDADVNVNLEKGIAIAGSKVSSKMDTSFTTRVASRYRLEVTDVDAQHDGLQGLITVATSQPLTNQNLSDIVRIEPSVNFETRPTDAGFTILSTGFDAKTTYMVTINNRVQGEFGGKLKEEFSEQVSFGRLDPSITFINAKGTYLSTKGYRNLALNVVQVPKVKVTVVKVFENNILQLLNRGSSYDYEADENEGYHDFQYYKTEDLGDTVFQKSYDTEKLPKNNEARLLKLDFADRLQGYNGVYVITIASEDQRWLQQSKILSLSDIGIIAKQEQDRIIVFTNSIRNATAINNAKISFISTTNQPVFEATTDKNGVALLEGMKAKIPGFHIGMVTAKMGDEYSFITFERNEIETSRFDVGGRPVNATGLNAWIYAERNLYRPGETIRTSVIVRNEGWMPPGEMPVKLRLVMPNGKEFATRKKILDEQGSTETEFDIPRSALTGTYVLQAYSGNDVLLNTYNFSIEDFVPDRIKADLKINKEDYQVGETIGAVIKADNLFGTPAANRNYEMEMNITKVPFQPKGFEDYDFTVSKNFNFPTLLKSGVTKENGESLDTFTLDESLQETGLLKGNIRATVFDETGRPVHRYSNFNIYSQPVFLGIKSTTDYVATRVPLSVNLIALNSKGVPQSQSAVVTVIRKEWQNVIQQSGERFKYVSQWVEKELQSQRISVSGTNTQFTFTPDVSGEYEVRIAFSSSTSSYVSRQFYAYGMGNTQYSSFEVNNEGNVTIKADKEKYENGENINLLFTTPFEGRMLVSVERDKVLEYYFLNTENKSASLKLKSNEAYLPNVYVSVTLFRPMDGSDMPLTVAHGYQNISVEAKQNKLPVTVSMKEQSRSKTKQTIAVKTAPNAYVTIAAVDEGILQVKNYQSPNPYDYFYQKVALAVASFDVYPWLLPEYKISQSSTGGDGGDEAAAAEGRVNPLFVNRIKNVSFWSGIVKADGSGNVKYDIDVPQFSGDLRVVAVAYKDRAFGSFDSHMKVADPIVISTALPRFLSPGDSVLMPITLSNTTAKETAAEITITEQGAVGIEGSKKQTVTIAPKSEARAVFSLLAAQQIGAGKVSVTVNALNETFTNETELAVRPAASLQKQFLSGTINAGSSLNIPLTNNFIPQTFSGNLVVATSPLVQFSKNLSYLVNYPYGCLEQTASSAFPQIYYGDLVRVLEGKNSTDLNPNYNVQQAIYKIQSMQLPNGSLSYWPGGNYESWWGSVFAAHFLIEANRAGFEVNNATLDRLLAYIKFRLQKKEVTEYYYNNNQRKTIAAKEVPYSLYVLALVRQPDQSLMNFYKGNKDMLSIDGKYLLAAAFSLSGQADKAQQTLPPAFSGEKSETQFGGSFYSYTRDRAISLNALLDINPQSPQVAELARQLAEEMKADPYLNTQENVFAILALGKIARNSGATVGEAKINAGAKMVASTQSTPIKVDLKTLINQPINITTSGKGTFYYFKELAGVSADGSIVEEDKYLKVRRSFYDRNGNAIGNTFKQNDLIVVKITISGEYRSTIENVVITDMLPAGLEIENTRLTEMPNLKWISDVKEKDEPDYLDIRDDRLNIFTSVSVRPRTFYYMVRAVSPGSYKLGPVQADAMYNGMYHSYNGSGTVRVLQ